MKTTFWILAFFLCYSCLFSQNIDQLIKEQLPLALKEHREFVSLPCDANFPEDMMANVEWMEKAFTRRGFEVSVFKTSTVPVVLAEMMVDASLPTVLFYLHFDGQPVDPSKWQQEDPFTPVVKMQNKKGEWEIQSYDDFLKTPTPEHRIYARAAADDKGPILMVLNAMDLMKKMNRQPAYNIKVILDGEEEIGSAGLKETLEANKKKYAADHIIIMDGPAHTTNRPTLTFGWRGIATATLTVYGAQLSQHSGHFGNYAPNPVFRMSHMLASMKDEEGRVLIEGFYDGISFDESTKKVLANVPDNKKDINERLGVVEAEKVGMNYQEALQYPSLNVRGMAAAWVGKQARTIVPDKAVAEIDIRLVPESDGDRLISLLKNHIEGQGYYVIDREPTREERLQYEKIATFSGRKVDNAFRTHLDSPTGQWLTKGIRKVYNQDPVRIRIMGGTVPVAVLVNSLDAPAVVLPMVNMDNNQHSPTENLRVGNLINGIKTCVGIFSEPIPGK
jgi:acetylornithine deacetylase/succinyl-diaminopimelate desuccinylase-like protein